MNRNLFTFGAIFLFASVVFAAAEGLTKEQIQQTIQKNSASVIKCYEVELKSQPGLKGRVQLSFDIGLDGKVIKSSVAKTTLNHQKVENCIVESSKTWIFHKRLGTQPVHVEYPFELRK